MAQASPSKWRNQQNKGDNQKAPCPYCQRSYHVRGLSNHKSKCWDKQLQKEVDEVVEKELWAKENLEQGVHHFFCEQHQVLTDFVATMSL
jgi:hypothetical protein